LSPEGAKLGFEMSFALSGLKFKKTLSQGASLGLRVFAPMGLKLPKYIEISVDIN
jgi:hypothetical protein